MPSTHVKRLTATMMAMLAPFAALADPVADFYANKKVQMMIGFGSGEAYDAYARILGRVMGNYLPGNPAFLPQNVPGAGSLNAANAIYNTAPKDGTVFGTAHRFVPLMPCSASPGRSSIRSVLPISVQ